MASILRAARGLVSKKKRRLVDKEDGFDLDLSYIADRLIGAVAATGTPCSAKCLRGPHAGDAA